MSRLPRESVAIPGLPTLPVTPNRGAENLIQLLGLAGNVLGDAARLEEARQREAAARSAAQEQEAAAAARVERGLGTRHAQVESSQLAALIDSGQIVPDGDPEEQAMALLSRFTAGHSDAYVGGFMDLALPNVVGSLAREQAHRVNRTRQEHASLLSDAMLTANTPEDVLGTVQDATRLGFTEREAYARVVVPALDAAARNGDRARFEVISGALGGQYAAEQLEAQRHLATVEAQSRRELADAARNVVFGKLNQDAPPEESLAAVQSALESGQIDNEEAYRLVETVISHERERISRVTTSANNAYRDSVRQDLTGLVAQAMLDVNGTGGAPMLPAEFQFTDLRENTVTISRGDMIEAATEKVVGDLQRQYPPAQGETISQKALAETVAVLSRNGVLYGQWRNVLNAGGLGLPSDFTDETKPPAAMLRGFDLYRRVKAMNGRLASAHIDNPVAEQLYSLADLHMQYSGVDDPSTALLRAAQAVTRTAVNARDSMQVNGRLIREAVDRAAQRGGSWLSFLPGVADPQKIRNRTAVMSDIESVAMLYMLDAGLAADDAVAEAAEWMKDHTVVVNGYALNVSGVDVPPDLADIADLVIDNYLATPEGREMRKKDIALAPLRDQRAWILRDMSTPGHSAVPGWERAGIFTAADLEAARRERREMAVRRTAALQRSRTAPDNVKLGAALFASPAAGTASYADNWAATVEALQRPAADWPQGGIFDMLRQQDESLDSLLRDVKAARRDNGIDWTHINRRIRGLTKSETEQLMKELEL